ncbi:MAG TPA: gephyrin-like molybdotransferase Glp [Rhizomicrobium sp.]|nr:gephyrin-like molybdotransferase Glp [Rhizomicrobium sp.]
MISVDEAIARITAAVVPLDSEIVQLHQAHRRVLARDTIAQVDQPPAPVSAMDGYAVRFVDAGSAGAVLHVIGTAPAGHPFEASVGGGEAVRIFTGGVLPEGGDAIVVQEDVDVDGERILLRAPATNKHIRVAGLDFRKGDALVRAGKRLSARDLALLAAGDIERVEVRRKPVVAFAATGDELSLPGEVHRPGGIVASSGYALRPLLESWGADPSDLGILADSIESLQSIPARVAHADAVVTMGGASVGDHDLVQRALVPNGFVLDFWKIAMRPGKPLIFGKLTGKPFLGLPGNPVSSYVCATLFLQPLVAALLGTPFRRQHETARLSGSLRENDTRQDYIRARLFEREGHVWAEPFPIQDSSMQSGLARADALIVRPPHAPPAKDGDRVDVVSLDK